MKILKRTLFLLLLALMASPVALLAQGAGRETDITGTVFRDANNNGRLDGQDRAGKRTAVWLYRVLPNGKRRKVGRVTTDANGRYTFGAMPIGRYFIAARFTKNLAIRTPAFTVNGSSRLAIRNIPTVNRQTVDQYPDLRPVGNPANLDDEQGSTPFSPNT
jgi:hypothetical protein